MRDHNTAGGTPVKETAKRAKWSAEQRKAAVLASLAAGASINEVAERFGVQPSLLSTWRRKYTAAVGASKSTTKTAQFAAVRVKEAATDGVIEIDQASRCVRVRGIVDIRMLREVLAVTR